MTNEMTPEDHARAAEEAHFDITTAPIAELLAHLNNLRHANGKKPLASWKNSRTELELRIQQEQPAPTINTEVTPASNVKTLLEAINTDAPVTVLPPTAPELTKPAKRKAAIDSLVKKAIDTDTPTTTVDVKGAAKRHLVNKTKKKNAANIERDANKVKKDLTEHTARVKETEKKIFGTKPQGKGDFAKYLEEIGMEGRVARAKLRRAKIAKNADGRYDLTDAVRTALSADGRKKDK